MKVKDVGIIVETSFSCNLLPLGKWLLCVADDFWGQKSAITPSTPAMIRIRKNLTISGSKVQCEKLTTFSPKR